MFTGIAPDAATILQAGFLDYIRVDATNEDTKNNLDDRAVEALALVPIGNRRGEWHCLSLDTFRLIKRAIRPSDVAPMPPRVVELLNAKGAKYQQELTFMNARGVVADLPDDMEINSDDIIYCETHRVPDPYSNQE